MTITPGLEDSEDDGVGDVDGVGDCDGVGDELGDGELGTVVVVVVDSVGDEDGCTSDTSASAASSIAFARSCDT